MALFRHCLLGKINSIRPSYVPFYSTFIPESAFLTNREALGCLWNKFCGVTNSAVHEVSPLKGTHRNGGRRNEKKSYSHLRIMFVPAILKGIFPSDETEELTPEKNLVNHIKRSILLMENGEPQKAERLLHIALKMAQDMKHEKGITYVYDTMANLAFENGEHQKAQALFVEVLKRLIGSGLAQDDIIVINISLKIADTFLTMGDYTKSEQGFLFCLDSLKKKITEGASDEDTLILYTQTLDRYSLFLLHVKRPNEAVKFLELALEMAETVFGNLNNKIGAILLSDMGVIKTSLGEKEEASQCFEKALAIANQEEVDTSAAVIMVNRGLALKESGLSEEARHWCTMGQNLAIKEKNKSILKAAEECLKANSGNRNEGRTPL
ncbi:tetratricopeptide repeat protein 19 homolog, mitochondrial [Thrips palmi]|uniref:Tetratricopeptide repeat protein 19 homolog, mitochondrial n=1 Tax=Thrips palmi TaxID=161013 RepID=A0A6P8YDD2_THRPL|nr:tetratricopeptide repeat protein 19 homolog, mitochondrial [Thrips palmi]